MWLDALALDARGPVLAFAVATAVLAVLALRCAAAWREGARWRTTLAVVFRSVPRHPLALVRLAGAVGAAAVLLTLTPVVLFVIRLRCQLPSHGGPQRLDRGRPPGLPPVPAYAAEDFDAGLAANRSLETGLPFRTRNLLPSD
ncbi:hypothetical protein OG873_37455 [Streptomyces violaceus]|uniref:hypothetical protein n=1 Tax=Streptomyces violaceus TaxID=1936 RepID=UPI002E2ADA2C|nr:hypothetical protein [Streptomyces violaceus]